MLIAQSVFVAQLFAGLGLAFVLFFTAAGLNLVWGVLGVMNFAAGAVYMLGAYLTTSVVARLGASALGWGVALLAVPLAVAALGALAEVALLRRTYRERDENRQFMLTLALSYLVAGGVALVYGTHFRTVSPPGFLAGSFELAGTRLPSYTLATIALGVLVTGAIGLGLARTRAGLLTRAAVDDREMLAALGVDVDRLHSAVFAVGIGLGALGGVLVAPQGAVSGNLETTALVPAFVVVVTGGLGDMAGALAAALAIGVIESFLTLRDATLAQLTPYAVMSAVLLARAAAGRRGWALLGVRARRAAIAAHEPAG